MKFETLNKTVPYVYAGEKHLLSFAPYEGIVLKMPGRHARDTNPIGGDFVVCVTDSHKKWKDHQFTHEDLFSDIERRMEVTTDPLEVEHLICAYAHVASGTDPEVFDFSNDAHPGVLNGQTFLRAVQCLAVAEHRRYYEHEAKGGGRYLPLRFAFGIAEGKWSAAEAAHRAGKGRVGLDILMRDKGRPLTLQEWKDKVGN